MTAVTICSQTSEWFFRRRVTEKINVVFATLCLMALMTSLGIFLHRYMLANASGKRWCVTSLPVLARCYSMLHDGL